MSAAPQAAAPRTAGRWASLGLGGVLALHLALVLHFAPPAVIFSGEPVYDIDYSLHYYQVDRALEAVDSAGKLWGYDPRVLAGHPAGALEDISSKTLELFVLALRGLGVPPPIGFNIYILLIHLLVPLCGYAAARLFRLSRWQAVGASLLWVLLWFFDSFLHWLWFCGMISWAAASMLAVLLIALLYRALDDQALRWFVPLVALTALLALLHPFAALIVAAPAAALYLRDVRALRPTSHLAVGLAAAAAVATAGVWLMPALDFRHYLLEEETFLRPTLDFLLFDLFDLMRSDAQTGPPVRTMVRVVCLFGAGVALVGWRREGDRRFLPLTLLVGVGLAFAYLGGHLSVTRMSQPYRQLAPAALGAAIPAAVALSALLQPARLRAAGRPIQLLLVLALLLVLPRFVRNVLYYFPELLPEPQYYEPGLAPQKKASALVGYGEPRPFPFRHTAPPRGAGQVRRWLEQQQGPAGRVLIQDYMLGEYLAATSELPILGGLIQRAIPHADAHLFRLQRDGDLPDAELEAYFERYAVRFVVMTELKRKLEWRKHLLTFRELVGGTRIYETRIAPSYFLAGSGRVAAQQMNRVVVQDARPAPAGSPAAGDLVLRFHWMETLRCRPDCQVQRHPVQGDRVGFIRVPSPPPRFEIYNSYDFGAQPRWRAGR